MENNVIITPDGLHRYRLDRSWNHDLPKLGWVLLNANTSDGDTATIRRMIQFADDNGYGSIVVVNLFACRATSPAALAVMAHYNLGMAVGPENNQHIAEAMGDAWRLVLAWGEGVERPILIARARLITQAIKAAHPRPTCLGLTKGGQPLHPLMVSAAQPLLGYTPAEREFDLPRTHPL